MSRNPHRHAAKPINERRLYWEIGFRVRIARETRDWNQTRLAKEIGLSRTSLTNVENGKQRVTLHMLYQIASTLEINPSNLLPTRAEVQK
jgi:transcriptional regulator with XRE-family HTH domain